MELTPQAVALHDLGYTPREADFLAKAALHSGCFVMRQYLTYCGTQHGRTGDKLTAKLLINRHAATYGTSNRTLLYQLAKPVFVALGEPDNRNRRIKQPLLTRLRLMALDFVLQYPEHPYLATEAEKTGFFRDVCGLSDDVLPARTYYAKRSEKGTTTRYFIEKYPVFRAGAGASFAYLDESSMTSSRGFLTRYRALLEALPESRVVYVCTSAKVIEAAEACFAGVFRRSPATLHPVEWESDFRERRELESRPLAELDQAELRRLRTLIRSPYAHRYEEWLRRGAQAMAEEPAPKPANMPRFQPCILPTEYSFL